MPAVDAALVIRAYTGSPAYLEALQRPGSVRHDIDGHPVGEVDEGDRQRARERLAEHARHLKAERQHHQAINPGPASRRIRA